VDSPCIGNKCIVSFYCKREDKSICALTYSPCLGGLCFIERNTCDRDVKCSGGVCNGFCTNKYYNYDYTVANAIEEYSVGHFTYKNAFNYFEKLDIPCYFKVGDCPKYTVCTSDSWYLDSFKCKGVFYCKNKNNCSFNYNKNADRAEISKYKNEISKMVKRAEISKYKKKYGLENNSLCWRNKDCFSNKCIIDKVFIGFCAQPSDSDVISGVAYLILYGVPMIIIGLICCFFCKRGYYKIFIVIFILLS